MEFKRWFEAVDIFGFDAQMSNTPADDNMLSKPIHQFDLELMMDLLAQKSVGLHEALQPFVSETQWGRETGAVKLEVDTGLTFYIKRLGIDKVGNPRWITKKMFQLNRQGYGGLEDSVAQEVHGHIVNAFEQNVDSPRDDYSNDDLENLTTHLYNKIKRTMKDIFIPAGIKKVTEYAYIISLDLRGHGLEAQDQRRIEQNQTMVSYDQEQGTIRIFNYNIESETGRHHRWELMENDLDIYFFPSQDREEISECLAIHFKYY